MTAAVATSWPAGLCLAAMLGSTALAGSGSFVRSDDGVIVTPAAGPAGRVRLQVMGERIIHVTAVPGASFDLPASLMVVAAPAAHPNFRTESTGGLLVLRTAALSAEVSLASGAVAFRDASGKRRACRE